MAYVTEGQLMWWIALNSRREKMGLQQEIKPSIHCADALNCTKQLGSMLDSAPLWCDIISNTWKLNF